MVYLELFLTFVKIGFTSFGGMSMIPLIMEEMRAHHWMAADDFSNLVAIAEMTPGPLGVNCATFAGTRTAGFLGGLAAVFGVLTPAFTLTLIVAVFFHKFKTSRIMANIMRVIKPVCIAMVLNVILTLSLENYVPEGKVSPAAVGIGVVSFYLLRKRSWTVPRVIVSAAALGCVCFGGGTLLAP